MRSVTVNQVLSWEPCEEYTRERLEELFAGRETVNVNDVLKMDISDTDKLWAALREDFISAETLHEFACRVAENALLKERKAGREPDARIWKALEVKRKWLKGEATDSELAAAREAARAAAWAAAWAAAREAAWEAAWAAARAAAREAAWAAAWGRAVKYLKRVIGGVTGNEAI
jgi:hypothetical protein